MTTTRDAPLSRADGRAAQVVLVLLPVLYLVLGLGPDLLAWVRGTPLRWTTAVSLDGPEVGSLAGPGVVARWSVAVVWTLSTPTVGERAASLLPGVATLLLLVGGCLLAWRLVRDALAGRPFGQEGPRRLRLLALLVVGYGAVVPTLHVLAGMVVLWRADRTGAQAWVVDLSGPAVAVTTGLLLLVVAECFRIGRRLAQDVEGLV